MAARPGILATRKVLISGDDKAEVSNQVTVELRVFAPRRTSMAAVKSILDEVVTDAVAQIEGTWRG